MTKERACFSRGGLLAVIGLGLMFAMWSSAYSQVDPTAQTSTGIKANAEVAATMKLGGPWVIGAPLWALVTFENKGHDVVVPIYFGDSAFNWAGYQIALADIRSGKVLATFPGPDILMPQQRGPALRRPSLSLPAHDRITLPIRLRGPWELEGSPAPGDYRLDLIFGDSRWPDDPKIVASCTVAVRAATNEEATYMKDPSQVWVYPTSQSAALDPQNAPKSLKPILGMDWEIHRLFMTASPKPIVLPSHGADADVHRLMLMEAIRQMDPEALAKDLPAFYDPILNVLRYEILHVQEKNDKARTTKETLLKQDSGFAWAFDWIDDKGRFNVVQANEAAARTGGRPDSPGYGGFIMRGRPMERIPTQP